MMSASKLSQTGPAMLPDLSGVNNSRVHAFRSGGSAPLADLSRARVLSHRSLGDRSCLLSLLAKRGAAWKMQERFVMAAQGANAKGLGKPAVPVRWHPPVESRDSVVEGRRATVSKRRAAGGLLERDTSTEEDRTGSERKAGQERHSRTSAPGMASKQRPQIAFSAGVEKARLHDLGCEQSRKTEGGWSPQVMRGPFFLETPERSHRDRQSEKVHRQGAKSPAVGKMAELGGWGSVPKARTVREGAREGFFREEAGRVQRQTDRLDRSPRASEGPRGENATPQKLSLERGRLATRPDMSADVPSTSGRSEGSLRPSLSSRQGRYSGAVPGRGMRDSAFEMEPVEDSEEEEEARKAGAEAAGEHITYDSLKKDDVDGAVRIEKQLLRDGLLVSQARSLALYVVKNEIPGGYSAIQQRLTFLEALHGMKPKQAVALLLAQKRTLKRPVHELEGNVGYLLTAGVPVDQLGNVVRRSPQILLTSVTARLEPSVRCLKGLGLDVGKMVVKNPRVITYDLEGRAHEVINYLHSVGLSLEEVQALLEKDATLLTMTLETLAKKVEFLFRKSASVDAALDLIRSSPHALYADVEQAVEQVEMVFATFGLEVGDTFELLIKWPALMSMTKRPMLEKVEFVINELGWSVNDVLAYPLFLSFSLEKKLRPRCEKVLGAGIVIARPNESEGLKLHTMLVCSDDNFEHYLSEIWPNKYRRGSG